MRLENTSNGDEVRINIISANTTLTFKNHEQIRKTKHASIWNGPVSLLAWLNPFRGGSHPVFKVAFAKQACHYTYTLRCSNEIMEGYLHRKPPHSFTTFNATDAFYWAGWADVFQSQRERWKKCSCNAESLRKEIYESMSSATKKYNLSRRNADWLHLSGNFLPSFPSLSRKGPLPLLRKLYPKHDRGLFPDLLGLF